MYRYCNNNPINATDPSGHFIFTGIGLACLIGGTALGLIGTGAANYGANEMLEATSSWDMDYDRYQSGANWFQGGLITTSIGAGLVAAPVFGAAGGALSEFGGWTGTAAGYTTAAWTTGFDLALAGGIMGGSNAWASGASAWGTLGATYTGARNGLLTGMIAGPLMHGTGQLLGAGLRRVRSAFGTTADDVMAGLEAKLASRTMTRAEWNIYSRNLRVIAGNSEKQLFYYARVEAAEAIARSNKVGGRWGIFATARGAKNPITRIALGLRSGQNIPIALTDDAARLLTKQPIPWGPWSATRRILGLQSSPLGTVYQSGRFVSNEVLVNGVWRQATLAERGMYHIHQFVLDYGIDAGIYSISYLGYEHRTDILNYYKSLLFGK